MQNYSEQLSSVTT